MQPSEAVNYKQLYEESQLVILELTHELAQLKRMIFGITKERFVPADIPGQLSLGLQPEDETSPEPVIQTITYTKERKAATGLPASRSPLPDSLPRVDITIEPDEDIAGLKKIGELVTEELDYKPGSLFVNRYIRPKYARENDNGIAIGTLPSRPIDKGMPGPGLLAQIMVDKFADHLPVYRQVKRFEREGMKLASSTICGWLEAGCNLMEPVYERLKHLVLSSDYLQADETPIAVLDEGKKGHTHRGYHWVYYDPLSRLVFFDYREGRGREGPLELLKDFRGYLQTDGYPVYDMFEKHEAITLMGCMAHGRRYFDKALDDDRSRAEYFLKEVQQLYALERKAREEQYSEQQVRELRQDQARPILEKLHPWLKDNYKEVLPMSPIGKAIAYVLARWEKLSAYTADGRLQIDNNLVENQIRPVAIGRKNYLFAGSHEGARRAAMLYSLLGSCKALDLNPFQYLRDILSRLPDHPINQIQQLLPHNWQQKTS